MLDHGVFGLCLEHEIEAVLEARTAAVLDADPEHLFVRFVADDLCDALAARSVTVMDAVVMARDSLFAIRVARDGSLAGGRQSGGRTPLSYQNSESQRNPGVSPAFRV